MRIHLGKKDHKCPHCSYSSVRKDNLRSHMKTHYKNKDRPKRENFTPVRVFPTRLHHQTVNFPVNKNIFETSAQNDIFWSHVSHIGGFPKFRIREFSNEMYPSNMLYNPLYSGYHGNQLPSQRLFNFDACIPKIRHLPGNKQ